MASTSIFLRNLQGKSTVYVIYRHGEKSKMFNTGIHIDPHQWVKDEVDLSKGVPRTKENAEHIRELKKQSDTFNLQIGTLELNIKKAYSKLNDEGINPDVDQITAIIEGKKSRKKTFQELKNDYLATCKLNKGPGTYRQIKCGLLVFEQFAKENKYNLNNFDIYTPKLYDSYMQYLYEDKTSITKTGKKVKKSGLYDNTAGARIKALKTFLNWSIDHGYHVNAEYKKFKVLKERAEIIYLSQSELDKLESTDFQKPHLNRVRDVFLFQCYTGLRVSDLMRLDQQHVSEDIIQMTAFKNKNKVFIPLTLKAKHILEKYDGKLPVGKEQVFNRQLKDMAELAGLDRMIEQMKVKAGKKIVTKKPLYELIKSHLARKTFISLSVEKGIQPKVV